VISRKESTQFLRDVGGGGGGVPPSFWGVGRVSAAPHLSKIGIFFLRKCLKILRLTWHGTLYELFFDRRAEYGDQKIIRLNLNSALTQFHSAMVELILE
jgi:hypothetical protein